MSKVLSVAEKARRYDRLVREGHAEVVRRRTTGLLRKERRQLRDEVKRLRAEVESWRAEADKKQRQRLIEFVESFKRIEAGEATSSFLHPRLSVALTIADERARTALEAYRAIVGRVLLDVGAVES